MLDCYEDASVQKINRDKTSLFFSRNTKAEVRLSAFQPSLEGPMIALSIASRGEYGQG
jgi:hypothetical protein